LFCALPRGWAASRPTASRAIFSDKLRALHVIVFSLVFENGEINLEIVGTPKIPACLTAVRDILKFFAVVAIIEVRLNRKAALNDAS
jgi:hypothetical protein